MFQRLHCHYVLLLLGMFGWVASLSAAEFGRVERLQGEAWVEHGGKRQILQLASTVARDDQLTTGPGSRLQIALVDGGRLTLGENASLRVTPVLVESSRSLNRMDIKGAFRMVSAAAQAQRKQEWVVETSVATIGIRGTDFWGGPIDGALDVMVISGTVEVINTGGRVLLEPGQGTVVRDASSAPSVSVIWGTVKVQRALSMVAFPES